MEERADHPGHYYGYLVGVAGDGQLRDGADGARLAPLGRLDMAGNATREGEGPFVIGG